MTTSAIIGLIPITIATGLAIKTQKAVLPTTKRRTAKHKPVARKRTRVKAHTRNNKRIKSHLRRLT